MAELTLEAVEKLLTKKLDSQTKELTVKIETEAGDLGEMIEFLTRAAVHKEDLKAVKDGIDKKFGEQAVSLTFIESQLATLRKDLEKLSQRTKDDDGAFSKELLKLKNRLENLERQFKRFKVSQA